MNNQIDFDKLIKVFKNLPLEQQLVHLKKK